MLPSKKLKIIHFNDCYDLEYTPNFLHEVLKKKKDHLIIFSGDIFFPSVPSIKKLGAQMVKFLELINPDVGILGNHDFDEQEEHCKSLIKTLHTNWVMSNFNYKNGKVLCDAKKYFIKTVGNLRVGFIGLIDENYIESSELDEKQFIYENYLDSAIKYVKILKKEKCDIIIALTHMLNKSDFDLVNKIKGIDLYLGGHQHCYLIKRGENGVAIKSGCNFQTFNEIELSFDTEKIEETRDIKKDKKENTKNDFSFIETTLNKHTKLLNFNFSIKKEKNKYLNIKIEKNIISSNLPPKTVYSTYVNNYMKKFNDETSTPMAFLTSDYDITSQNVRKKETSIANLLTDLIKIEHNADVSFIQGGHFRSEKHYKKNHLFIEYDLINLVPFTDCYRTFKITGRRLKRVLEESFQHLPESAGCFGNISGLRIVVDQNEKKMNKIKSIFYRERVYDFRKVPEWRRLDMDEKIVLVSLEFCIRGKDGFSCLENEEEVPLGKDKECSLPIVMRFLKLPQDELFRNEFFCLKNFGVFDFENLRVVKDRKESYKFLTQELVNQYGNNVFEKLNFDCIKRLKKYCLAEDIINKNGFWIFSFCDRKDGRNTIV